MITNNSSSGQSNVFQFILFFITGIIIFTGIGNFFMLQSEYIRDDASNYSVEIINGYISSIAISSVDSCKGCDSVETVIKLSDTTFGYFIELTLNNDMGLTVSTAPEKFAYSSTLQNLKSSIKTLAGSASSVKPINLTYDRNQNRLEIK